MAHTLAQWLQLSDGLSRSAKYLRDVTYALATEPPNGQEQAPYDDLLRQFDGDARSVPWRSAAAVVFGNTKNRQEREEDGAKGGSQPIILPFDANLSQLDAIEKALTSTVSICQGPPGTGKTQTICNLLANLVIRQKRVLVVSPNNSATANVADKQRRTSVDADGYVPIERQRQRGFTLPMRVTYASTFTACSSIRVGRCRHASEPV